jgi:hypothetical protein
MKGQGEKIGVAKGLKGFWADQLGDRGAKVPNR